MFHVFQDICVIGRVDGEATHGSAGGHTVSLMQRFLYQQAQNAI